MRIEKSVEIARPPEEVWRFVSDPRNDPQWCDKVEAVEQDVGDGPGLDARYSVLHAPKPLRAASPLSVHIEEFEPPRRMRVREEDGGAVFHVTYELEETASGTRLTQLDEIEWNIAAPLRPIGSLMVKRHMSEQLAELQRVLERSN